MLELVGVHHLLLQLALLGLQVLPHHLVGLQGTTDMLLLAVL